MQELLHLKRALPNRQRDFPVDEVIIEIDSRRVLAGVAVEDIPQARPVDRGQAHRARLATGVKVAIVQLERLQALAGLANGDNLGMGRRVVYWSQLVVDPADDLVAIRE